MSDMKKVTLVLSDGTKFHGKSFGYDAPVAGEVVFNTAMMGYPESLTDPSYAGQLMTLTFPLVGNYGVPPFTFEENGLPTFMESDKIYASASSAPQIRYPDYYGIDMARLEEFCVFRAAIQLLKERKMEDLIEQTYEACKAELAKPKEEQVNPVRAIYKPFTIEEINEKIVEMLRPEGMTTPIQLVFQSIEGLREAIPNHKGDWYFTGHYPTPGGTKLCNQSFVNYIENVYHK